MDISVVKGQIKSKSPLNFYIFTGEEIRVQRVYIEKIAEISNKPLKWIDQVADVYKSKSNSLFTKSNCYICQDDLDFLKSEKGWETIQDVLGNNTLILLYSKLDKRGKFYKHFANNIVTFDLLSDDLLVKYIKKDIPLADNNALDLVHICENDYNRILLEIDKIKTYNQYLGGAPLYDGVFEKLLAQGIIYRPPMDAIFEFTDAVLMGKPRKSFKLLEQCKLIGEPTLRLLLVLYNNARKVLQVQSCESRDIANVTGLSAWDIKVTQPKCGVYSNGELVRMLKLIHKLELGIKSGRFEDSLAMDYLLINIF